METENCWTFEKDEMLIELVKNIPGLYNIQSPHYSDNNYKKKMWNDIERVLQLPAPKTRWESLRAQYRKYLAKLKTKSGQKGFKISKWRHFDQMQFINHHINVEIPQLPFVDEEKSNENTWIADKTAVASFTVDNDDDERVILPESIESDVMEPVIDSDNFSTNPVKTRKRKNAASSVKENTSTLMKYLLEKQQQERAVHPMDHFFSLMAITAKQFTHADQYLVKTTVFNLVSQLEEKYLRQASLTSLHDQQMSPKPFPQAASSPNFNNKFNSHDSPPNCVPSSVADTNLHQDNSQTFKTAITNSYIQTCDGMSNTSQTLNAENSPSYLSSLPQDQVVKVEYQPNEEV